MSGKISFVDIAAVAGFYIHGSKLSRAILKTASLFY
jgi:hypothetical protein